ncbi:uncharacterized protein LOC108908448 [Anoplophora glabripennis]|uniref:uncharacterized protein LOC108908448 n=1 Tax=Anoplophora glabripennis TaxID=217634 RepID=UPI0008737F5B|nr:uncharacterized protein LOC108908448 [Anoplophora glabripennis]
MVSKSKYSHIIQLSTSNGRTRSNEKLPTLKPFFEPSCIINSDEGIGISTTSPNNNNADAKTELQENLQQPLSYVTKQLHKVIEKFPNFKEDEGDLERMRG